MPTWSSGAVKTSHSTPAALNIFSPWRVLPAMTSSSSAPICMPCQGISVVTWPARCPYHKLSGAITDATREARFDEMQLTVSGPEDMDIDRICAKKKGITGRRQPQRRQQQPAVPVTTDVPALPAVLNSKPTAAL
ncbi:hypothetical protein GQ54DRAFT_8457 [Martensiomyces pterosporus]|nr:hypothetical protein GQ54DRAFT_8457 [Martensiomyces pterosporus]